MSIRTQHADRVIVATVEGRFDVHMTDEFQAQVTQQVSEENPHVVVDMSAVEFMDSSALAALVRVLKRTIAVHGFLALAGVSDSARIIFELTRLDEVFEQYPTVRAALRALHAAA